MILDWIKKEANKNQNKDMGNENSQDCKELNDAKMEVLKKKTHLTNEEINQWHKRYYVSSLV